MYRDKIIHYFHREITFILETFAIDLVFTRILNEYVHCVVKDKLKPTYVHLEAS